MVRSAEFFFGTILAFAVGQSAAALGQVVAARTAGVLAASGSGAETEAVTLNSDPSEPLPSTRGWDASVAYSANHDSASGWSNVVSPAVAYRLNSIFSADASIPVYLTLNAYRANVSAKNAKVQKLQSLHDELGDAAFSAHAELHPSVLDYAATISLSAPTGDTKYGLSPGRLTWNENNHFERAAGCFTPDVELGIGDNAALNNRRVKKSYTSLGTLAYFQVGTSIDLPLQLGIEVEGYEQLPLGSQKVYTTVLRKKKNVQVLTASGDAEDNGINTSFDRPLGRHLSGSVYYSRSLRMGLDTAGIGLSYHFHAPAAPVVALRPDGGMADKLNTIF